MPRRCLGRVLGPVDVNVRGKFDHALGVFRGLVDIGNIAVGRCLGINGEIGGADQLLIGAGIPPGLSAQRVLGGFDLDPRQFGMGRDGSGGKQQSRHQHPKSSFHGVFPESHRRQRALWLDVTPAQKGVNRRQRPGHEKAAKSSRNRLKSGAPSKRSSRVRAPAH
jgi:hypothetical protein